MFLDCTTLGGQIVPSMLFAVSSVQKMPYGQWMAHGWPGAAPFFAAACLLVAVGWLV